MASISAKHGSTEAASRALDIALDTMFQASIRDEDTIAAIVRNRIEIDESGKAEELLKSAATNLAQLQRPTWRNSSRIPLMKQRGL